MNPQGADLLSQLRDIHAAPAAPLWPPAPGWWVLAMMLVIGLFLLFRQGLKRYRAQQRRQALIKFVDRVEQQLDPALEPQEFLSSLNRVIKIVALRAFPDNHCALMQGREWTDFVQIKIGDKGPVGELSALADGPYQQSPSFNPAALTEMTRRWIMQYG